MGRDVCALSGKPGRRLHLHGRAAYREAGISDEEIDDLLKLDIPDNAWFNRQGIYNYHGGGSVVFSEKNVQDWILQKKK